MVETENIKIYPDDFHEIPIPSLKIPICSIKSVESWHFIRWMRPSSVMADFEWDTVDSKL